MVWPKHARDKTKFRPGQRPAAAGRKAGTPNKRTVVMREVYYEAFHRIGGVDRLVEWIKESPQNEYAFHTQIMPRLAVVHIAGQGPHGEIEISHRIAPEDLAKKLEERGLPPLLFGVDQPVLDLEAVVTENVTENGDGNGKSEQFPLPPLRRGNGDGGA